MDIDHNSTRLRRTWNKHLPKYSSLPELRLPLCHRRCTEPKHDFKSSIPRTRHASAPPRVFIHIDLAPKFTLLADNHDLNRRLVVSSKQTETISKLSVIDPLITVPSMPSHMPIHRHQSSLIDTVAVYERRSRDHIYNVDAQQPALYSVVIPEEVATATLSSPPSFFDSPTNTFDRDTGRTETDSSTHTADASWTLPPLTSEGGSSATFEPEGIGRARSDSTTTMKPNVSVKVSRRAFAVGYAGKIPPFHLDTVPKNVPLNRDDDETTSSPIKSLHSPKHQHFRPLRRKNHLHVMPSSPDPDLDASEPIAISLTLHHSSPATSSHISKKSSQIFTDYISPHSHTRVHSDDPVTPPMTPTHQRSPPASAPPKLKNADMTGTSSPESSPLRLGHPSRPYYTAIRKNGVSPSPSRRPQSQPPPSSFHLGFDSTSTPIPGLPMTSTTVTNTSRHLSMSAMTPSPPAFSALYDGGDGDDDDGDNDDLEIPSGPTNSARLSLSSNRSSYNNHTHQNHTHHHVQSLSRGKGIIGNSNGSSAGIGFSMSGETELRMALASSSAPSGGVATIGRTTHGGFRFRETVIPSENNIASTNNSKVDSSSRTRDSGFMGRVKKLRKGLKEMLMNKNTTTATTATTR